MRHESEGIDYGASTVSTNNGERVQPRRESHRRLHFGPINTPQNQHSDTHWSKKMYNKGIEALEMSHLQPEDLGEPTELAGAANIPRKRLRMRLILKFVAFAFPVMLAFAILRYKGIKAERKELRVKDQILLMEELRPPAPPFPVPWSVPSVETSEEQASLTSQLLRAELRKVVDYLRSGKPLTPSKEGAAIMELAIGLTEGTSSGLLGRTITLTAIRAVGPSTLKPGPRKYLITRLVGEGLGSVLLAVEDQETAERFTMRMSMAPLIPLSPRESEEFSSIERARAGVLTVCGEAPLDTAGSVHGVAALRATALIQGVSQVISGKNIGLLPMVELMEALELDLGTFVRKKPLLPTGWKAFLARRCLKTVLHLQHSGLSHNQVCSSNFFFHPDGLIVLSGFDSSVPFGEAIAPDVNYPAITTDPSLLLALSRDEEDPPVRAGPESDLWSLGALLYEIMMDGKLPYKLSSLKKLDDPVPSVLQLIDGANPLTLNVDMARERISYRWRLLISRLLEPDPRKRISSQEIVADFQDLMTDAVELEIFDVRSVREFP